MKTIETIATITPSGEIQLSQPENLPIGTFKVVLVIDELPIHTEELPEISSSDDSFLATAGDLIGCLEGLPPDLAHNKSYLEGLGR